MEIEELDKQGIAYRKVRILRKRSCGFISA